MRKNKILVWLLAAVFAATFISLFLMGAQASDARRVVIEIENFEFVAQDMNLRPGDVVVFINRDIAPHTATALDGSWDSGLLESGESWEMVIIDEVSLAYFCRFHPSMKATLAAG